MTNRTNLSVDNDALYVFEFPNGIPIFADNMKQVREFVNSEDFQTLIQDCGGAPELLYYRNMACEPSRLDYDKWIVKD